MATINFFTRTESTGEKLVPVYCRFSSGKLSDFKVKSGLQIRPEYFDNKNGHTRNIAEFQNKADFDKKLRDLKSHLYNEASTLSDQPSKEWLLKTIDSFHNPEKYKPEVVNLFSFIQDFINKSTNRVCYKQVREYERTFHYLKEFAKDRTIDFEDINLDFYSDFVEYLQSEKSHVNKKGKTVKVSGLAQNTIGKKIQTLKIFLNSATEQNKNRNMQYKSHRFTAVSEESEAIYLDENELQKIADINLSKDLKLDRVRDSFLIGCWTGLRFSDWNKVTPKNIDNGFLELKQQKTGGAVVIPLHPTVTAILKKYKGQLPRVLTNQKYNEYLKQVAQKAELNETVWKTITKGGKRISTSHKKWELVTTHTGRRSFATNLYKAGFPTLSIMKITGHRTEASFLKYIKVTPREHAEKLKLFWSERTKLKVV